MSSKTLYKLGLAILLIPLGFLSLFLFGEIFSGDLSGLSHLIQITPLMLIIFLAYKKPLIGGLTLLTLSLSFGTYYALSVPFKFQTILFVEALLFSPPFISGLLLILSTKKTKTAQVLHKPKRLN